MEAEFRRIIREELDRVQAAFLERLLAQLAQRVGGCEECISLVAAAARFGISTKTLTRWRDEKKLTRYGEGRFARVDPAEVRQAMIKMAKHDNDSAPTDDELRARLVAKLG